MKPNIVKFSCLEWIDGYIGVFCRCGRTLYIKNIQSKVRQGVDIECPCGKTIHTVYTRHSHN